MARKPVSRARVPARAKRPPIELSKHVRLPRSWRVVTARKLRASETEQQHRSPRREVPEIRLSGAWLERIGFPKGRRYLISVDKPIETIYLQAEPIEPKKSRRRR
jgi:hypothetical protein